MTGAAGRSTSAMLTVPPRARRLSWGRAALAAGLVAGLAGGVVVAEHVSAGAATTATWRRLAQCESGGNWHINTGNGYYGGLQFSQSTWVAMGGRKYAPRADLAKPREQMAVGNKLLKANHWSWQAWPVCSQKLGLTEAEARAMDYRVDGAFEHIYHYRPTHRTSHRPPIHKLP